MRQGKAKKVGRIILITRQSINLSLAYDAQVMPYKGASSHVVQATYTATGERETSIEWEEAMRRLAFFFEERWVCSLFNRVHFYFWFRNQYSYMPRNDVKLRCQHHISITSFSSLRIWTCISLMNQNCVFKVCNCILAGTLYRIQYYLPCRSLNVTRLWSIKRRWSRRKSAILDLACYPVDPVYPCATNEEEGREHFIQKAIKRT